MANKEQKVNTNTKKEAKMSLKEKREEKKKKSENKYKLLYLGHERSNPMAMQCVWKDVRGNFLSKRLRRKTFG